MSPLFMYAADAVLILTLVGMFARGTAAAS